MNTLRFLFSIFFFLMVWGALIAGNVAGDLSRLAYQYSPQLVSAVDLLTLAGTR